MKLPLKVEYALRALVALAESYDSDVLSIQAVSDRQEIPKRFLEQILNELRSGGFVESKRGIAGGYRLARRAENILLADVIRHIEGPMSPPMRAGRTKPNAQAAGTQAAIRTVIQELRQALVGVLERITLADLVEKSRRFESQFSTPEYII